MRRVNFPVKKLLLISVMVILIGGIILSGCSSNVTPPSGNAPITTTITKTETSTGSVLQEVNPNDLPRVAGLPDVIDYNKAWPSTKGKRVIFIPSLAAHPVCAQFHWYLEKMNVEQGFGLELGWADPEFDLAKQIAIIESAITTRYDLIIVSPIDPIAISPLVLKAQKNGIPVIVFNGVTAQKADFTVGLSTYDTGRMCADTMAKILGEKGTVGVIRPTAYDYWSVGRGTGFNDGIKQYPNMTVVADVIATEPFTIKGGYEAAQGILRSHPDINGIYAAQDQMAVGVSNALRKEGLAPDVVIGGNDADLLGLEYIRDGKMEFTNAYFPIKQILECYSAVMNILTTSGYKAGTMSGIYWCEQVPITIDNLMSEEISWPPAVEQQVIMEPYKDW